MNCLGRDNMITIVNENNEIIPFEDGKSFEVILDDIGYGLYLEDDLIEDYGSEELAVKVMKNVVENIEKGTEYIYMSEIHESLEV